MNRSVGVTICAVAAFVGSALTLGFGAIGLHELEAAAENHSRLPFTKESMLLYSLLSFAAGAWGVTTAFGLLSHREWARISILVFAWLCLVFCLLPMVIFPFAPLPHIEGTPVDFNYNVRIFATAFFAVFVTIGSWWLYFFSKKSVKDKFTDKLEPVEVPQPSNMLPPKRPLSITIVAFYLLITACFFTAVFSSRASVYGISGWEVQLIKVTYAVVQVFALVGLLELRPWGRTLTICYSSFLIFSTTASAVIPGRQPSFERLMATAPASLLLGRLPTRYSPSTDLVLAVILFAIPLWVMFVRKQVFVKGV